jgi:hypothetical protein
MPRLIWLLCWIPSIAWAWETPPPPEDLPIRGPSDFAHELLHGRASERNLAARELLRASRRAYRRSERSPDALEAQAALLDLRQDTLPAILQSFEQNPTLRTFTVPALGYLCEAACRPSLERVQREEQRPEVAARIAEALQRIGETP